MFDSGGNHGRVVTSIALLLVIVLAVASMMRGVTNRVETVPVSGHITIAGRPVSNVSVSFEPVATDSQPSAAGGRPGSYAVTDENGWYSLQWRDGDGAISGAHRVILVSRSEETGEPSSTMVVAGDGQLEADPSFQLPESARDGTLRFTVPEEGTATADFTF